jgi:hypothetical protein
MKHCRVMVNRDVSSAKFGVVIKKYATELNAWTEDYNRFYVEVPEEPVIRLVVEGDDITVLKYN